jgi:CheY-like chemotaxis protein
MGERILLEEGFEVVSVTDGETALVRLADVDPDLVLADASLPLKSGYEICRHIKTHARHRHTRVVLLETPLEPVDAEEARRVQADGVLRKPFEASLMIEAIRPLVHAARSERGETAAELEAQPPPVDLPQVTVLDAERVRAAVTVAVDAAMPALVDELTARVLEALGFAQSRGAAGS